MEAEGYGARNLAFAFAITDRLDSLGHATHWACDFENILLMRVVAGTFTSEVAPEKMKAGSETHHSLHAYGNGVVLQNFESRAYPSSPVPRTPTLLF